MRYLTIPEVLYLYQNIMQESGGGSGIRDLNALESAVAQPRMTFDRKDLYATVGEKAAALGFSMILNHPFIDGNKRIGHAVVETFLFLNSFEIEAPVDEQERIILAIAAGELHREQFLDWLESRVIARPTNL
ncbi:MAG TPA: type II toxin-antitoxin system death-on-curing family toxin [Pyrinomonadaceae bacterium]|nr:type II toxin-antitoxin system death-on-curing family toxin [Pyrinomonadaceae bacterium]